MMPRFTPGLWPKSSALTITQRALCGAPSASGDGTGAPPRARCVIVNADDFGQSPGVTQGIIEAHQHGIVTSASLMVNWPAAAEAAAYGRAHADLSLGLHFDVGEWCYRNEKWIVLYQVAEL